MSGAALLFSYLAPTVLLLAFWLFATPSPCGRTAPLKVLIGVWVVVFGVHYLIAAFQPVDLYPSSLTANLLVVGAVVAFGLGFRAVLALRKTPPRREPPRQAAGPPGLAIDLAIMIYAILVVVWALTAAGELTGDLLSRTGLQIVRTQVNYRGADWGLVAYLGVSVAVAAVYLNVRNRGASLIRRAPGLVVVICAVGLCVLFTQRTSLFLLVIGLVFATSARTMPGRRTLLSMLAALVLMFLVVGLLVGKGGTADLSASSSLLLGLRALLSYFVFPLTALDQSQVWVDPAMDGAFTLRFPLAVLDAVGLSEQPPPGLVQPFIRVPALTNVYTVVHAPLSDFGPVYLVYFLGIGGLLGLVFSAPRENDMVRTLQGFCIYPVALSFFQDQFLTIASTWVQILALTCGLHLLYGGLALRRSRTRAGR